MAQQVVNIGENPDDGTGDPIREAFRMLNENFAELYAGIPSAHTQVIGDGTATTFLITHNLAAAAVDVVVRRTTGAKDRVLTPYTSPDTDTVVVSVTPAPLIDSLLVTVTPVIGA